MKTVNERAEEAVQKYRNLLKEDCEDFDLKFPATLNVIIQQSIIAYADDMLIPSTTWVLECLIYWPNGGRSRLTEEYFTLTWAMVGLACTRCCCLSPRPI